VKHLVIIFGYLLVLANSGLSQGSKISLRLAPDEKLSRVAVDVVNKFSVLVKRITECSVPFPEKDMALFSPDAIIEVGGLKSGPVKRFSPQAYFQCLNALKCKPNAVYRTLNFDYRPVSAANARIVRTNDDCFIIFIVQQTFTAKTGDDPSGATGILLKSITLDATIGEDGEIHSHILGVQLEALEINEKR